MPPKFGRIGHLKRDRKIEGEVGADLKIDQNIFLTVLAASDANVRWRDTAPKVLRELRRLENAGATTEEMRARYAALYADVLIIGWRGVVDADGKPVAFTRDNVIAFLLEADDAMSAINDYCFDTVNFRSERAEAIVEAVKK